MNVATQTVTVGTSRETVDLFGHGHAERTLLDACRSGRLPHAWMLTGPRGIGKATLAFRFARFVLSGRAFAGDDLFGESPTSLAMPADDPVFRRVASRGHADFLVVDRQPQEGKISPRTEIVVADIRGIGNFLHLTAAEGGWRVIVIDDADAMNRNAANALLKILEEPPADSLLILVCHNPGRLPPTVRSRCRQLTLQPLPDNDVARVITAHVSDLAPEELHMLVRLAEGRPGYALSLAAEGGLKLYRELVDSLNDLPRLDLPAIHALADRLNRPNAVDSYRTFTALMTTWLARMVRDGATEGDARGEGVSELVVGEAAIKARLLEGRPLDRWVEVWEKIGRLFTRAESVNLERRQVILDAYFALQKAADR